MKVDKVLDRGCEGVLVLRGEDIVNLKLHNEAADLRKLFGKLSQVFN